MSQDREKYLYFNVGLLKSSFALDALWQDALKYHMIDQPGKLIALRLTEYYEMMARGILQPGPSVPATAIGSADGNGREGLNGASSMNGHVSDDHLDDEGIVAASPNAEQNADEAAEYWANF